MSKTAAFFVKLLQAVLLLVLAVFLINSFFLKPLLESFLSVRWETDVSIRRAQFDRTLPGLVIEDMKVGNPYGFPRGDMLDIERVALRFDKTKPFFEYGALTPDSLRVRIRKIELMRRVSGHLNLETFTGTGEVKGWSMKLAPRRVEIEADNIAEINTSTPLLKRDFYLIESRHFSYTNQGSLRQVLKSFAKELLQRVGEKREENAPQLPPPQYRGITAMIEEGMREQNGQAAAAVEPPRAISSGVNITGESAST